MGETSQGGCASQKKSHASTKEDDSPSNWDVRFDYIFL